MNDPFDEAIRRSREAVPLPVYPAPRSWPDARGESHDVRIRAVLESGGGRYCPNRRRSWP